MSQESLIVDWQEAMCQHNFSLACIIGQTIGDDYSDFKYYWDAYFCKLWSDKSVLTDNNAFMKLNRILHSGFLNNQLGRISNAAHTVISQCARPFEVYMLRPTQMYIIDGINVDNRNALIQNGYGYIRKFFRKAAPVDSTTECIINGKIRIPEFCENDIQIMLTYFDPCDCLVQLKNLIEHTEYVVARRVVMNFYHKYAFDVWCHNDCGGIVFAGNIVCPECGSKRILNHEDALFWHREIQWRNKVRNRFKKKKRLNPLETPANVILCEKC